MKRRLTFFLIVSVWGFVSCAEDEPEINLVNEILGSWNIQSITYEQCDEYGCNDSSVDFANLGLIFTITRDSVLYNSSLNHTNIEKFRIEHVIGDTLKLSNRMGVWDFVISNRTTQTMQVTAIVPFGSIVYNDILTLYR